MRKCAVSIEEIKNNVLALRGKDLKISVNKGRKRIVRYRGNIADVFPSVFVLNIVGEKNTDKLSFSYSDVICGDIKLDSR